MSANSKKSVLIGIGGTVLLVSMGVALYVFLSAPHAESKPKPLAVVGVGLYMMRNDDHKLEITRVFPNSPAEKAGVVPGLVLNKVGSVLIGKQTIKEVSKLLAGPEDSKVMLELTDAHGNVTSVEVRREQFVNRSGRPPD